MSCRRPAPGSAVAARARALHQDGEPGRRRRRAGERGERVQRRLEVARHKAGLHQEAVLREVRAARRRLRGALFVVPASVGDERREVRVQLPHRLGVGQAPGAHQGLAKRLVQRAVVLGVHKPPRHLARLAARTLAQRRERGGVRGAPQAPRRQSRRGGAAAGGGSRRGLVRARKNLLRDGDDGGVVGARAARRRRRRRELCHGGARLVRLRKEREARGRVRRARRVEPREREARAVQCGGVGAGSVRAGVLGRAAGRRRRRRAARRAGRRRRLPGVGARRRRRRRPALQVRRARARLAVGARGRRTRWRRRRAGHVGEVIVDALRAGREVPRPRAQRLGQRAREAALQVCRVEEGRPRGAVLLPMLPARRGGGCELLVHLAHGALGGRLFDERAAQLEVVGGGGLHGVLQRLRGGAVARGHGAGLLQQRAQLRGHRRLERLAARHQCQRAGERADHQMRGFAQPRAVRLDREVLQHELARRHARDGHRALHHRRHDFPHRRRQRHRREARQRHARRLGQVRRRRDLDVLLQTARGGVVRAGQTAGQTALLREGVASRNAVAARGTGTRRADPRVGRAHRRRLVRRADAGHGPEAAARAGHGPDPASAVDRAVLVRHEVGIVHAVAPDLVQQVRGLLVLDLHLEVLEEALHLELEVELEVALAVDLLEQPEHRGGPGVRRLEDDGVLRRFQHLRDERDDGDHVPGLVRLQHQGFQIEVAHQHRLVARDREVAEPRSEVLEQRALARVGLHLVAAEQRLDVAVRGVQHESEQRFVADGVQQTEVQHVEVGLDGRALHDEVHGEPPELLGRNSARHLGGFFRHVLRRQVVHHEVHLVHRLRVRHVDVLVRPSREQRLQVQRRGEPGAAAAGGRRGA